MGQQIHVETDTLRTAGGQAQSLADQPLGSLPTLTPPGGDATSVSATAQLAARGASLVGHLSTAAAHAAAGGTRLNTDAATFEEVDQANRQALITGVLVPAAHAGGAPSAPTPQYTDVSPPAVPTAGVPVDPEVFATQLHEGGDRGVSLQAGATYWRAASAEATRRAATLRSAATQIANGGWVSDNAPARPAGALEALAQWHEKVAAHATELAAGHTAAYQQWADTAAKTPTPTTFTNTRTQLEQANQANVASGGRYTPVVMQVQNNLATLRGTAATSAATYTTTSFVTATPVQAPPPVVTPTGGGDEATGGGGTPYEDPDRTGKDRKAGEADDPSSEEGTGKPGTADPTATEASATTATQAGAQDPTKQDDQLTTTAAQAMPSLLMGIVGAAVSLPAAAAAQAASTGSQVVQGLSGAAQSFQTAGDELDDDLGLDDTGTDDPGVGDVGAGDDSGGGGGGGGENPSTEPAATTLGTNAALAVPVDTGAGTVAPVASPTAATPTRGGMPMGGFPMMPHGAGAGAGAPGGGESKSETKKAVLRPRPNTERIHAAVDRELAHQQHAEQQKKAAASIPGTSERPRPTPTPRRGTQSAKKPNEEV